MPLVFHQRGELLASDAALSGADPQGIHGSSTCLLALLHDSTLSIANLGDCCLLIVRGGEIIFRTDEMQHAFNFPLQLGTHSRDEPMKDAQRYDVSVSKGDIVVLGSDGLMDNLVSCARRDTIVMVAGANDSSTKILSRRWPSLRRPMVASNPIATVSELEAGKSSRPRAYRRRCASAPGRSRSRRARRHRLWFALSKRE